MRQLSAAVIRVRLKIRYRTALEGAQDAVPVIRNAGGRRVRVMESWYRHREKRLAENAAWREANRERHREYARRWIREHREQANLTSRLKKQRRRAAGTLTKADWLLVLKIYGNRCLRCDRAEFITIEHIVPISVGGANDITNVQPLCNPCNGGKRKNVADYRPFPIEMLLAERITA